LGFIYKKEFCKEDELGGIFVLFCFGCVSFSVVGRVVTPPLTLFMRRPSCSLTATVEAAG
jgi:hypothetical protein